MQKSSTGPWCRAWKFRFAPVRSSFASKKRTMCNTSRKKMCGITQLEARTCSHVASRKKGWPFICLIWTWFFWPWVGIPTVEQRIGGPIGASPPTSRSGSLWPRLIGVEGFGLKSLAVHWRCFSSNSSGSLPVRLKSFNHRILSLSFHWNGLGTGADFETPFDSLVNKCRILRIDLIDRETNTSDFYRNILFP